MPPLTRVHLTVNGCLLHLYITGEGDLVEVGKPGIAPMSRRDSVTLTDADGRTYEVAVGEIEGL
jgi:hypothetical protein